MSNPIREWTHWAAGYGLPRASLKLLARRGDPLARLLTIDANPVDNIYPLIEQVASADACLRWQELAGSALMRRLPARYCATTGYGIKHLPVSRRPLVVF